MSGGATARRGARAARFFCARSIDAIHAMRTRARARRFGRVGWLDAAKHLGHLKSLNAGRGGGTSAREPRASSRPRRCPPDAMPSEAYSGLLYYITGSRPALPPIVVSSAATPFCALSRRPRRRIFQTCRPTIAKNVRDAPAAAASPRSRQQRRVELRMPRISESSQWRLQAGWQSSFL